MFSTSTIQSHYSLFSIKIIVALIAAAVLTETQRFTIYHGVQIDTRFKLKNINIHVFKGKISKLVEILKIFNSTSSNMEVVKKQPWNQT